MLNCFSRVRLFATLWTIAHRASLSMGWSGQEYWSGLPCPPPGDLLDPGIKPGSPALQVDSLPTELSKEFHESVRKYQKYKHPTKTWEAFPLKAETKLGYSLYFCYKSWLESENRRAGRKNWKRTQNCRICLPWRCERLHSTAFSKSLRSESTNYWS